MPLLRKPRDPSQRAKLVVDMATGEVRKKMEQEQLTGRAKSAKARGRESDGGTLLRRSVSSARERTTESLRGSCPPIRSLTWPHAVFPGRND